MPQIVEAPGQPESQLAWGTYLIIVREDFAGALQANARDRLSLPYSEHQLARIYLLVSDPEKALDQLELLLKTPSYLSPAWLRIDPTFAPLRGNPRFERLVNGP